MNTSFNTSFASQLIGFILTNGTFESDPEAPRHDGFVIKSEGIEMRIWQPREGWFHLAVVIGDWDNATRYYYSENLETTFGRNYATRHQSIELASPDKKGGYKSKTIQYDFYQKSA